MRRAVILPAAILLCSCATLQTLADKATKAQREAEALARALDAVVESCQAEPDPKPDLCKQAEQLRERLDAFVP